MLTLTEGDSRPKPEQNSNRERDDRRSRAADFARSARSLFGMILLASGLAACSADGISGPPAPQALTRKLVAGPAVANVIGDPSGEKIPVDGEQPNSCNGELVPFRGHAAFALFVSDDDVTHERVRIHYVFDGMGSFGNVYHGTATHFMNINSSIFPMTWTEHHQVRMTSKTAPDMIVSMKFHFTINAMGRPTAFVEKGSPAPECRT